MPVRDEGVLVAVGEVPPETDPVDRRRRGLPVRRRLVEGRAHDRPAFVALDRHVLVGGADRRLIRTAPFGVVAVDGAGWGGFRPGVLGRRRLAGGAAAVSRRPTSEPRASSPSPTSRVSRGHVDSAAARRASRRTTADGRQLEPGRPGEVDDAGELGDGEAVEVTAVPLDGVVDAPAGDLERVERVLGVGDLAVPQRV